MKTKLLVLIAVLLFVSCNSQGINQVRYLAQLSFSTDTIPALHFGLEPNSRVFITSNWDLQGLTLFVPDNVELVAKGGVISNGCIVGSRTLIKRKETIFDKVQVQGSWIVPVISTSMFADLNYDNSLKDVFALTNSEVHNKILIEKGEYQVSAYKNADRCLNIGSNTEVIFNGTVRLKPNDFPNYSVISIAGDNIVLKGSGCVIGDKMNHVGNAGEWGMGINLWGAKNVSIKGLTVKECWGDCIYIGGSTENVIIEKCTLDNGRRQGVSITSGNEVKIRNCVISNVSGTVPEYAIDVEPNANNRCDNIVIDKVTVNDCKGGFLVYGKAVNAQVGMVIIRKSSPSGDGKPALGIVGCDNAIVEECTISQNNSPKVVVCREVKSLAIKGNTIHQKKSAGFRLKKTAKRIVGRSEAGPICVTNCEKSVVEKNIEE